MHEFQKLELNNIIPKKEAAVPGPKTRSEMEREIEKLQNKKKKSSVKPKEPSPGQQPKEIKK